MGQGERTVFDMKFTLAADGQTKPFKKHWQFCVGSGHAAMAMRTDYVEQLKFIHDELDIQRVRFHGIFHDDMHTYHTLGDQMHLPGSERFTEKSFHYCGLVYDNLLKCGVKPFVELGFMPEHMAKTDARSMFFYKPSISLPKDENEWCAYIRDFVRFLIRRYGREEVESWYFEVWNEPDLEGMFFDGSQADYFHFYEITARAVKSVDDRLMVGGPSTSGSKWVASFVRWCKKENVPLDFVTTHQYAGDPLGGVEDDGGPDDEAMAMAVSGVRQPKKPMFDLSKMGQFDPLAGKSGSFLEGFRMIMPDRSETSDIANDIFKNNSAVVKEQAQGLPVFYTEWNENAGFSAYTNDTRKVAAYDAKAALDVEDNVTGSSVWCFSDIFEELHPFPNEFHGGFGMQTIHGIPKPVFYAFKMLTQAGNERYILPAEAMDGEISMAAFKGGDGIQVMLIRQKMKNLDLPAEEAEVSIQLPAAPQKVTLERIDEDHCNPLRLWEEMGSPLDLTPAEVDSIRARSQMVEEEIPYTYENGVLTFKAALKVNDVYFVRIQ
jgi:xylan 1,4-beta-xylosidase